VVRGRQIDDKGVRAWVARCWGMTAPSVRVATPSTSRAAGAAGGGSESARATAALPRFTHAPSPLQEIGAGMFAGACDVAVTHPIDTVRTQFHLNPVKGLNPSVPSALRTEFNAAGGGLPGVKRLYRGVLAAAARPQAVCMFTGNELCKRIVALPDGSLNTPRAYLAGAMTGFIETAGNTPFEVVKVRMQSKEHMHRFTSTVDCLIKTGREEGLLALYKGAGPSAYRNFAFNGIYFGNVFASKKYIPKFGDSVAAEIAREGVIGVGAAIVAVLFKNPFDVAKSRFQSQITAPGEMPLYRNTLQTLRYIAHNEGIKSLYKGYVPTAQRCAIGYTVAMFAFDACIHFMQDGAIPLVRPRDVVLGAHPDPL